MALGFDREILQIDPAKNDTGIGGRRDQSNVSKYAGMKTHTFSGRRSDYGGLKHVLLIVARCYPDVLVFVP